MSLATPKAAEPSDTQPLDLPSRRRSDTHYWMWVLCLLGLDYFSTLAYQPSLTFEFTGRLGPLATALVVLVTLLGALPVYCYLAGRSPRGEGSLGLLERLVRGWRGKTLVLVLLGFAATDFTMLKAISLADASVHLLRNDLLRDHDVQTFSQWLNGQLPEPIDAQLAVTLVLVVVGFVFWFLLPRDSTATSSSSPSPWSARTLCSTACCSAPASGGSWNSRRSSKPGTDSSNRAIGAIGVSVFRTGHTTTGPASWR